MTGKYFFEEFLMGVDEAFQGNNERSISIRKPARELAASFAQLMSVPSEILSILTEGVGPSDEFALHTNPEYLGLHNIKRAMMTLDLLGISWDCHPFSMIRTLPDCTQYDDITYIKAKCSQEGWDRLVELIKYYPYSKYFELSVKPKN